MLGSASSAQSEIYKWVDDQGQIHFSDRNPEQVSASPIVVPPAEQNYSKAAARLKMGKIIPIYADEHLRIRLIHETDDQLVFDVEYMGMQELYPDINYENVSLMISTYNKQPVNSPDYSYLAIRHGIIKEDSGSLICRIGMTKRTPSGYAANTLKIFLYQNDFRERPGSYQFKKNIMFEKIWRKSAGSEDRIE
jgi:hypothetical protein